MSVLTSEAVAGCRPKDRALRIASNSGSPVRSNSGSCLSRGKPQQATNASNESTMGFLRHGRTKRMMPWKAKRPCLNVIDRARRTFFPPSPGYPSLGCTPAEPNSVSPGNIHHSLSDRRLHKQDTAGIQVAQNATAKNTRTAPKPAEPDHRLETPQQSSRCMMMRIMLTEKLTSTEPALH